MSSPLFALFQFFPLSLFASYAFWHGAPSNARWLQAFELGAVAGLLQQLLLLLLPRAMNRLLLGANLYLIGGGLAAMFGQWWYLQWYGRLSEAGIFLSILLVGGLATVFSRAGFVPVPGADAQRGRRASWWMLAATTAALLCAIAFRGDRNFAAVLPIIGLAVLQRVLARRLRASATDQSASTILPVSTVAS